MHEESDDEEREVIVNGPDRQQGGTMLQVRREKGDGERDGNKRGAMVKRTAWSPLLPSERIPVIAGIFNGYPPESY